MKKILICILILVITYNGNSMALAVDDIVQVSIPQFNITLNGKQIDSSYKKYPLLQYKDIVYIPIEDCTEYVGSSEYSNFLGISYTWHEPTESYYIKKKDEIGKDLVSEKQTIKNQNHDKAQIIDNPIYILDYPENISFENKTAAYPILKYRDVLYFPLTWQYVHDVFGWEYQWTKEKGLYIDSRDTIRPELYARYPGEEISLRALASEFQYTYFSDGYAKYYKNKEDPSFFLEIKIKGYPKVDFGVNFKERFFPTLETYTMPGKINQFWSEPNRKIENSQIDISHNKNIVTVPFVVSKDIEHKTEIQNCIVTLDMETEEIVSVKNLSLEEAYRYNVLENTDFTNL